MTFSNKSPNFDLYWEIITTIGVAMIIAKKDVTVAAVKEPAIPANDPVIGFPLDIPRINHYERTPTGKSKLKKITVPQNSRTKYLFLFESSNLTGSLGVPDTFADLLISLPL